MWKEKLRAFCEGLEVENIDMLLEREVDDFRFIGQVMATKIKEMDIVTLYARWRTTVGRDCDATSAEAFVDWVQQQHTSA